MAISTKAQRMQILENKLRKMVREELMKEGNQAKIVSVSESSITLQVPNADKAISWIGRLHQYDIKCTKLDDTTIKVRTYELLQYAVNQLF
jgi:hypothetical protein